MSAWRTTKPRLKSHAQYKILSAEIEMNTLKALSKKTKIVVAWTAAMTSIGTAILHQWQFFTLGCISVLLLLIANQCGFLSDPDNKK